MSIKQIVECDVCGITKKQVNHWWCVGIDDQIFRCWPFEKNFEMRDGVKHVCGKQHVIEMFNRFLETGQIERSAPSFNEPQQ